MKLNGTKHEAALTLSLGYSYRRITIIGEEILLQLELAGALAIIVISGASAIERGELISLYAEGDIILQRNRYLAFRQAVNGTYFDVLLPEVARKMTIILAINENQLNAAIEKGQTIYNFPIFHRLIRE